MATLKDIGYENQGLLWTSYIASTLSLGSVCRTSMKFSLLKKNERGYWILEEVARFWSCCQSILFDWIGLLWGLVYLGKPSGRRSFSSEIFGLGSCYWPLTGLLPIMYGTPCCVFILRSCSPLLHMNVSTNQHWSKRKPRKFKEKWALHPQCETNNSRSLEPRRY